MKERLLARRVVVDDCWIWPGAHDSCGYGRIWSQGRAALVHREAWVAFCGDPGDLHVLHSCEHRDCFNPDHLHLGTHQENMAERDEWGHGIRGERVAGARLTAEQVLDARSRSGETWVTLAERYGVSPSTIRHAVTGRTWRHLGS
jgi:hypothetical protein